MSLCLSCGFCCDGTLFDRVPMTEPELVSLRVQLAVAPGVSFARQPCAALEGTACQVYEQRPLTCRRYRCLLLEAHEANEVSLEHARIIVDETKALRAALNDAIATTGTQSDQSRDARARLDGRLRFHFLGHRSR